MVTSPFPRVEQGAEFTWYASGILLAFTIVAAVAGYVFWISLGGKPLFAGEAL